MASGFAFVQQKLYDKPTERIGLPINSVLAGCNETPF
jgi:hypothetical protein